MRRPPNLHLHSFQRISQEWNGEASKVQSLFRLSRRGERRPRASLRQARRSKSVPRRIRKRGLRVAAERQAIVVRANNEILPSRICSSACEISTGKTARSCARNLSAATVDRNKDASLYQGTCRKIFGKIHRASMRSSKKRFPATNLKSSRAHLASSSLQNNAMNIKKENIFLTKREGFHKFYIDENKYE